VTSDPEQTITYKVRWRLSDGTEHVAGPLTTRRRRGVGDFVNLPNGPDGRGREGKGYIWRVTALEDDDTTLVLAFERPHPERVEDVESE
jgi:hypothetical protein